MSDKKKQHSSGFIYLFKKSLAGKIEAGFAPFITDTLILTSTFTVHTQCVITIACTRIYNDYAYRGYISHVTRIIEETGIS